MPNVVKKLLSPSQTAEEECHSILPIPSRALVNRFLCSCMKQLQACISLAVELGHLLIVAKGSPSTAAAQNKEAGGGAVS